MYNDFLSGEINFKAYNIEEIATPTGEPEKRYHTDYAIVDSNGDGLPELHIRSVREFRVFQVDKDGNEHIESEFYWRDLNWNAIYDEDDQYFFDEEECTETEWIKLTQKYIYINDERKAHGHADILDEAEWTIYCEQKG